MLTIKRKKDNRVAKCIMRRVADISGGVGVSTDNLGGSALLEGTPIGKGANGLYQVCKTAKILTQAESSATTYEVAKGHHFNVGDHFATSECAGQAITKIDRSNQSKDIITVGTTLGNVVKAGTCAFESDGSTCNLKVTPVAIAGSTYDVTSGENLFVDAWVISVVNESNAPAVNESVKTALKGIVYV